MFWKPLMGEQKAKTIICWVFSGYQECVWKYIYSVSLHRLGMLVKFISWRTIPINTLNKQQRLYWNPEVSETKSHFSNCAILLLNHKHWGLYCGFSTVLINYQSINQLMILSGDLQRKKRDPYPTEMTHDAQSHRLVVSCLEPISYQGLNNKEWVEERWPQSLVWQGKTPGSLTATGFFSS